jgi:predicted kinase
VKRLLVLRGLQASGKSTRAASLVMFEGYKRVNKDDMRAMIDNKVYSKPNERFITETMMLMIDFALQEGYSVVSDNTNFDPWLIQQYREVAAHNGAELIIEDINTPLEVCIERDFQRTHGRVGKDVIMKTYNKWFKDGKFPGIPPKEENNE